MPKHMKTAQAPEPAAARTNTTEVPTWEEVVHATFRALGGTVHLKQIYSALSDHTRATDRDNWRARVRATIEAKPSLFVRVGPGVWSLSSLHSPEERAHFEALRRARYPLRKSKGEPSNT